MSFKNRIVRIKQIASFLLEGHTEKEAAEEFKVCKSTIQRDLDNLKYIDYLTYAKVKNVTYRIVGAILTQNLSEVEALRKFNVSRKRYKDSLSTIDRYTLVRLKTRMYKSKNKT